MSRLKFACCAAMERKYQALISMQLSRFPGWWSRLRSRLLQTNHVCRFTTQSLATMQQRCLRPQGHRMNAFGLFARRGATPCARPVNSPGPSHTARAAPEVASDQATSSTRTSFHHGITHTSYEGNCWSMQFNHSGVHILVDPWLEGDLTFFNQDWVYRGKKRVLNTPKGGTIDINKIMSETDVVVLTQYLDDHLHMPTIRKLPRDTLIIANPEAAAAIQPLGFTNVKVVDHGETVQVANGRLRITASAGSLVGPPWSKRQNAYTFREVLPAEGGSEGASLFYEPHCDFVEGEVAKLGKVDVVVTPVRSTLLGSGAAAYPLVMGDINLIKLLKLLKPKVLVPLLNSEIDAEGPLSKWVYDRGSVDQARQRIRDSNLQTRLEMPAPPGEALAIAL